LLTATPSVAHDFFPVSSMSIVCCVRQLLGFCVVFCGPLVVFLDSFVLAIVIPVIF
jgi:hypothetical protein